MIENDRLMECGLRVCVVLSGVDGAEMLRLSVGREMDGLDADETERPGEVKDVLAIDRLDCVSDTSEGVKSDTDPKEVLASERVPSVDGEDKLGRLVERD